MWQATHVQKRLNELGYETVLHPVKSRGDLNLDEPLYEMGITGIFTKTLDVALVKGQIDIAVHSLKDVPTRLPKGMVQAAVPERASHKDILVHKSHFNPDDDCIIATGSLRRKSQWLNLYPKHEVVDLRGNVNTRLKKLVENKNWSAAIFAKAGLERIDLLTYLRSQGLQYVSLDGFIPAPAQGAMMVAAMQSNEDVLAATTKLNDRSTEICVNIERIFLNALEGGCTAPIGALAAINNNRLNFVGCLTSLDGQQRIETRGTLDDVQNLSDEEYSAFAKAQSQKILRNGGAELMQEIKKSLQK
jgi:hydroxymethylbilane synthase